MLTALDHCVLLCRDIDAGVKTYQSLLGKPPVWQAIDNAAGTSSAVFSVSNMVVELLAPLKDHAIAARFDTILGDSSGRLTSLAFATGDIDAAHHTLTRRGLAPSPITHGASKNILSGSERTWRRFRCDDGACAGIKTFILSDITPLPGPQKHPAKPGLVEALDHLVINTPNPERAIAHYGARLGLRFALDRTFEAFHARFLFFRIGGLTLEIIHRTDQESNRDNADKIWGITWRTDDLEAAHDRLKTSGLTVSPIREGRKPGTRVFTVKDGTMGIPTLYLAND